MRSTILFSIASLASVCLVSSGYGCGSSNGNSPGGDGGTGNETSSGSSGGSSGGGSSGGSSGSGSGSSSGGLPGDDGGGGDSGGDGAMPCTAMAAGTKVLNTTGTVVGVTTDNQVIYYDPMGLSLAAVPVKGGATPATIGPINLASGQDAFAVGGGAVVVVKSITQMAPPFFGKLTVWTAATGAKQIGTATYVGGPGSGVLDVSSDGKYVLYTDNATATTADIYVAAIDGSSTPVKLVGGVSWGSSCAPLLYFVGNDAVVSYCTEQPDASTQLAAQVVSYSGGPAWQISQNFTMGTSGGLNFFVGHAGSGGSLVAFTTSAGLQVEAIGGSAPTTIDPNGVNGFFNNAGTSLIYFDKSGNVMTSPVTAGAPAELVAGKVPATLGLSPDDQWLEVAKTVGTVANSNPPIPVSDMFLVSTTASGADGGNALTTLDGMVTGANFGDPFTADSKHATFYTAVNASGTGTFMSLDLPPTGTASPVSMTGWEGFAATGAKVVYDDNFMNATGSLNGYADIHSVDLSVTPPAPKTVASQADSFFYMTADKSTIVYSWHACPGANEGIYSAAVP